MNYSIGVDIGGTKVAIAVVNESGVIHHQSIIPTELTIKPEVMIHKISEEIKHVVKNSTISIDDIIGVGIGAPGPLDSKNGMITCPPNLPTWTDIPIRKLIEEHLSIPVILENDANAAALAEKWIGAAQENENFIYITVSTGIGAGIIDNGKLLRGQKGNAGDIGHMVVDPSFGECSCGQSGCLESIASGTAIAKRGSKIMERDVTTEEVFDLFGDNNPEIVAYIESVYKVLGVASVNMINTFDPEKIVIGGGVSKVGDPLFKSIRAYVSQYALNTTGRKTEIVPAQLDQSSGVIGAAALFFE